MKRLIALGFSFCLTNVILAAETVPTLPKIPANCAAAVAEKGYCSETVIPSSGPFTIRFFVVVEKEKYPTVENLLDKYLAFDMWPAYVDTVGSDAIVFNKSVRLSDFTDANGATVARQYYDYKIKSPIGYQKIRGVTHNTRLMSPYAGSLATIEFAAQTTGIQEVPAGEKPLTGAEGVRSQSGIINALECTASDLCKDTQWLLAFESSIAPTISILPKIAAASVEKGLEAILVGMLFNDVP